MQFEFGNPGIVGTGQALRELPRAVRMQGALANSLVESSKEYVLLMPYLVPRMVPSLPFEPLAESCKETGYPTAHYFWVLPDVMFELDDVARSMGLVGNVLHGFPISQWPVVHNFLKSVGIYDSRTGEAGTFGIQKLTAIDPFAGRTSNVPPLFNVYTLVVATPSGTVCWVPSKSVCGCAVTFRPEFTKTIHAESVGTLVDSLLVGDSDPLDKVEEKHGLRNIQLTDKVGNASADAVGVVDGKRDND